MDIEVGLVYLYLWPTKRNKEQCQEYSAHMSAKNGPTVDHRWELPGNYPVFNVVMVIHHYVERIWRILVTPF